MSFHDVMIVCFDLPVGKTTVHMHWKHCRSSASIHARPPTTIKASEPRHLFLNPISMPVTYIHNMTSCSIVSFGILNMLKEVLDYHHYLCYILALFCLPSVSSLVIMLYLMFLKLRAFILLCLYVCPSNMSCATFLHHCCNSCTGLPSYVICLPGFAPLLHTLQKCWLCQIFHRSSNTLGTVLATLIPHKFAFSYVLFQQLDILFWCILVILCSAP